MYSTRYDLPVVGEDAQDVFDSFMYRQSSDFSQMYSGSNRLNVHSIHVYCATSMLYILHTEHITVTPTLKPEG
jgi:hypothetical protein